MVTLAGGKPPAIFLEVKMTKAITFGLIIVGLVAIYTGYSFNVVLNPSEPVIPHGMTILGTLCLVVAWGRMGGDND